ncbi:Hypothetical predicted protein [Scomber scombrus]|uniref:Uncharacterized protein n=1 Tax=Scomber scombrus TaxID=13677 RepID=A0AAV1PC32_SCOSC
MFDVIMAAADSPLVLLVLHSSQLKSDGSLSLPQDDDDDLRAKQCCSTLGLGQKTRSPTVPVYQLLETHSYDTVTDVLSKKPCFTGRREENRSEPFQAVQVENIEGGFATEIVVFLEPKALLNGRQY